MIADIFGALPNDSNSLLASLASSRNQHNRYGRDGQ
jgi:hypothetical protein